MIIYKVFSHFSKNQKLLKFTTFNFQGRDWNVFYYYAKINGFLKNVDYISNNLI